ncbi:MAG: hypothetical protein WBV23_16405 [Desulfobaccales bacterium]
MVDYPLILVQASGSSVREKFRTASGILGKGMVRNAHPLLDRLRQFQVLAES